MRGINIIVCGAAAATLAGCSDHVVFGTHTSVGLDVSGMKTNVPDHVSLAQRRKELVYVPRRSERSGHPSVLGELDSEVSWTRGAAVSELFATGRAAEIIAADKTDAMEATSNRASFVTTHSTLGIELDFADLPEQAPRALFGFRRQNLAVVPYDATSSNIPSAYADISVHSSGLGGSYEPDSVNLEGRTLTKGLTGGARVVQTIATGAAADGMAERNKKAFLRKINSDEEVKVIQKKLATGKSVVDRYGALSDDDKETYRSLVEGRLGISFSTSKELRIKLHNAGEKAQEEALAIFDEL